MVRHQCSAVLCTNHLQRSGTDKQYRFTPCHWRGRSSHVSGHYPFGLVHRQAGTQAHIDNRGNWNGNMVSNDPPFRSSSDSSSHIIIAVIVAKNRFAWEKGENTAAGWAAVAMVWLFVVHFGYSWGPCAWIIVAEIWPLSNRPYGIALGASSNWMNNFIVGQVTPDMLSGISYGTYIVFGLLTYLGAAFIWFVVPETKRLTLEEMDVVFGSEGTAQSDYERMAEINREIGLDALLRDSDAVVGPEGEKNGSLEKPVEVAHKDETTP
jgi:hypothetical protein